MSELESLHDSVDKKLRKSGMSTFWLLGLLDHVEMFKNDRDLDLLRIAGRHVDEIIGDKSTWSIVHSVAVLRQVHGPEVSPVVTADHFSVYRKLVSALKDLALENGERHYPEDRLELLQLAFEVPGRFPVLMHIIRDRKMTDETMIRRFMIDLPELSDSKALADGVL